MEQGQEQGVGISQKLIPALFALQEKYIRKRKWRRNE
jgi:hypothetical protein